MAIRKLNLADRALAEELWAMQHAAYRQEARLIGVAGLPPLQETVQSLQNCGETFYGFYSEDEELAGAISTEAGEKGELVICRVMVHPEFFRQGIGTRLLRHVLSEAPSGTLAVVTAEARNTPAVRLYENSGFIPAGTFKPAPDMTMIRFEKKV